jgi:DNA-binding response OmpR family regulator
VLVATPGSTWTWSDLARQAWGVGYAHRRNELQVYVSRLRRKLCCCSDLERVGPIQTVHGIGYRFAGGCGAAESSFGRWKGTEVTTVPG